MKPGIKLLVAGVVGVLAVTVAATPTLAKPIIGDPQTPMLTVVTYTNNDWDHPVVYGQHLYGCPGRDSMHWGMLTGRAEIAFIRCDYPEFPNPGWPQGNDGYMFTAADAPSECPAWVHCIPWPEDDPNVEWVKDI